MIEEGTRDERGTMASDEDDGVGQELLGELCEIYDLGNVREVIAGEADCIGSTLME
jgi:hypothetical protein